MKSKSKILHLIAIFGCSLFCVNAATSTELKKCEPKNGDQTKTETAGLCFFENDKKIYNSGNSLIDTEGSYFFSSEGLIDIHGYGDKAVLYGYSCTKKGQETSPSCTLINNADIYETKDPKKFYNVYKNGNNGLSYQYVDGISDKAIRNAGSSSLDNAIILCNSGKCEKITPKEGDVFKDGTDTTIKYKIIKCSSNGCNNIDQTDPAVFLNGGKKDDNSPLIICEDKTPPSKKEKILII